MSANEILFPEVQKTFDLSPFVTPEGNLPTNLIYNQGGAAPEEEDEIDDAELNAMSGNKNGARPIKPGISVFFSAKGGGDKMPVSVPGGYVKLNSEISKTTDEDILRDPFSAYRIRTKGKVGEIKVGKNKVFTVAITDGGSKLTTLTVPAGCELMVDEGQELQPNDVVYTGTQICPGLPCVMVPLDYKFRRTYEVGKKIACSSIDGITPRRSNDWGAKSCARCPHKQRPCRFSCEFNFIGGDRFDTIYRILLKGVNYRKFFSEQLFKLLQNSKHMFLNTLLVDTVFGKASYQERGETKNVDLCNMSAVDIVKTPKFMWPALISACKIVKKYYIAEAESQSKYVDNGLAPAYEVPADAAPTADVVEENAFMEDLGEPPF